MTLFAKRYVPSDPLRPSEVLTLAVIGIAVIFSSLGLGEAVYRLLFFEFDGATDRLPIESFFGVLFALLVMKLVKRLYRSRLEAAERIRAIKERNFKIRHALVALSPAHSPVNQQAIRVIREEVERIDWALTEMAARS